MTKNGKNGKMTKNGNTKKIGSKINDRTVKLKKKTL